MTFCKKYNNKKKYIIMFIVISFFVLCVYIMQNTSNKESKLDNIFIDGVSIEGENLQKYKVDLIRYEPDSIEYQSVYNSLHSTNEQVRALEVIDLVLKDESSLIDITKRKLKVKIELLKETQDAKGNYLLWDKNMTTMESSFNKNSVTFQTDELGRIVISKIEYLDNSQIQNDKEDIKKISITNACVSYNHEYQFTGKAIQPSVSVMLYEKLLKEGMDYTVKYSNNVNVGRGEIVIEGKGDYEGKCSVTFKIVDKNDKENSTQVSKITISKASVSYISEQIYTGKSIMPSFDVVLDGVKLKKDIDYTISYSNNINPGQAIVNIYGKGKYNGTIKTTFTIVKQKEIKTIILNTISTCHGFTGYFTKDRNELHLIFDKLGLAEDNTIYSIMVSEFYDIDTDEIIFFCIPSVIVPWKFDNKVIAAGGYQSVGVKVQ